MGNNANNVSAGKPKVGGAIFRAPIGTTLPTDATTPLDPAFVGLGYASEDGVVNGVETDSNNIVAWGGDTVLTVTSSADETYQYTLIESLNKDVLVTVYGPNNVTVNGDEITIAHRPSEDLPNSIFVIEVAMTGGRMKRILIPNGKVTEVGEVNYQDAEAIGYQTTVSAFVDATGATAYEYISASQGSATVPDAPTIGTATGGDRQATVEFTPPTFDGGSPILTYTAISSPGGVMGKSDTSPITVDGLTNDTEYIFVVKATNVIGDGEYSAPSNAVTPSE
ncbi:fibronectin type III domain-containing protein [Lachnospiraceae bacterium ZAX-1]